MKTYGRTSAHEFLSDFIVFRNIEPQDCRLPGLPNLRDRLRLPERMVPRKTQPEYAQVIIEILREARRLDAPRSPIQRVALIGDTRLNDGTAYANVCRAGGWPGLAFIGADRSAPASIEHTELGGYPVYVANRWTLLQEFQQICRDLDFPFDEGTAVILDLDKTVLGARGRNDAVIDAARVEAVRQTVGNLLGAEFDNALFQLAYDQLNQPEFHPFTADNQDYLAYICLMLGGGLYDLQALQAAIREGSLTSFQQFIDAVDERVDQLTSDLVRLHRDIRTLVQQGDPTPFKAFRYNEYRSTVERMASLSDESPVEDMLVHEIVVTQEVREAALGWRHQGALLFGLSDKPDEASVPLPELAALGFVPIHRVEAHIVGE
ncbi:MAG: hypothetical protein GX620_11675 [Chloroflexi bacterium]|nr:hypothetical protein [Chloroflexota bacterium]